MIFILKIIFIYLFAVYFLWLAVTVLLSLFNPVHKANKKIWGFRLSGIIGAILSIIAIYFDNFIFTLIALAQLIFFYKFFGGEPDLDPSKLKPNTSNLNSFINNGVDLAISGEYNKSLEIFNQAINIDPKNEAARTQKANVLNRLHRDQEAINLCNQLLADNPNNQNALLYKGTALINLRQKKIALDIFNKLLIMDPNNQLYQEMKERCL
mgnify:CR=1 FL=1